MTNKLTLQSAIGEMRENAFRGTNVEISPRGLREWANAIEEGHRKPFVNILKLIADVKNDETAKYLSSIQDNLNLRALNANKSEFSNVINTYDLGYYDELLK